MMNFFIDMLRGAGKVIVVIFIFCMIAAILSVPGWVFALIWGQHLFWRGAAYFWGALVVLLLVCIKLAALGRG
jgi:hypothetical protein